MSIFSSKEVPKGPNDPMKDASQSSSGAERIVVQHMAKTTAGPPFFSPIFARHHPAISTQSTPSKPDIGPSKPANNHVCTAQCRRFATSEEMVQCGIIALPVSAYESKAKFGNETPGNTRTVIAMKERFVKDQLNPSVKWYHHNDYCDGYPCRGDIFFCSTLNRCFYKERCVKHYAMRSRERCIPFNDGLDLSPAAAASSSSSSSHQEARVPPPFADIRLQESSNKRHSTIPDDPAPIKRSRIDEQEDRPTSQLEAAASISSNQNTTPPSEPKTYLRFNLSRKDIPEPGSQNQVHPEQTLLTPSTGFDRLSPPQQNEQDRQTERSASPNPGEGDAGNDEIVAMWKGMYTQTKGELDATTVRLLQVQDDLVEEKERRVELEKARRVSGNTFPVYTKDKEENMRLKKQLDEGKRSVAQLSQHLNLAHDELRQLKDTVEKLHIEREAWKDEFDNMEKERQELNRARREISELYAELGPRFEAFMGRRNYLPEDDNYHAKTGPHTEGRLSHSTSITQQFPSTCDVRLTSINMYAR
ncbi:uncharacterized protein IL334_002791 [Kwoniella shivajii]|uniref:Uncharacterized protein n=1 Tax=Kwoniella shivajii TaxID=564305 RepID=A0ABZ1CXE4_9TREE|nr:hypothetical protein IL334_002791 [Kwoniella shivajii]